MGRVSFLVRSNPESRFSFFGGLGLEAGTSFRATNRVYYSTENRYEDETDTYNFPLSDDYELEKESLKTGASQSYSMLVPAGINLRLSKKHSFFSKLNFFVEFRWYVYSAVKIDGVDRVITDFGLSSGNITGGYGLRYDL